jgi:hypothetical protein
MPACCSRSMSNSGGAAPRRGFALIGQQIGHMDKKDHIRAAGGSAAWMVMVRDGFYDRIGQSP